MGDVNNIVAEYRNDISDKNGIKEEEEDQGPIVKKARIEKSGKPIFAEDDRLKQLYIEGVLDKEIKVSTSFIL